MEGDHDNLLDCYMYDMLKRYYIFRNCVLCHIPITSMIAVLAGFSFYLLRSSCNATLNIIPLIQMLALSDEVDICHSLVCFSRIRLHPTIMK